MTTRKQTRKLLDELPDSELEGVVDLIVARGKAEPTARSEACEHLLRIATGEDDGYDFAVSEHLHATR
jgi:hypothetical protein